MSEKESGGKEREITQGTERGKKEAVSEKESRGKEREITQGTERGGRRR